jgi:2-aminoadipate transaminase
LRDYLLGEARREGVARADDDLMITNGCQQALDLIARLVSESPAHGMAGPALNEPPAGVAIEDPVYHGLVRVFSRTAAELFGIPVDQNGMMPDALAAVLERQRPRLLVVTPSFQNPTGATMPISRRLQIVELAQRYGCVLVENDIYSALHYTAPPLPTLKELDTTGNTILLRSYSKVSFPGLRVGWIVAPWPAVARLAEVKETSDLHSDQLSQAVLLRFAESGELERHLQQTRKQGAERLQAALAASTRYLPPGTRWNPPSGGMNLWVQLPPSLTADGLLAAAEESGVDFLPGPHFSVRGGHARYLRISFGGLTPAQITRGIQILGQTASRLISAGQQRSAEEAAPALV